MSESTDTDYWFLRKNRLDAKTILRMLAIAYKPKEQSEKTEEDIKEEQQKLGGSLKHLHQEITEHIHPYVATKIEKIKKREEDSELYNDFHKTGGGGERQ